jgi:hypothetical protein
MVSLLPVLLLGTRRGDANIAVQLTHLSYCTQAEGERVGAPRSPSARG